MSRIAPQPWMQEPPTRALRDALAQAGIVARFVGGVVRDALLGRPVADIDLATPARPEAGVAALEKACIKGRPAGSPHGPLTALVPPRHFEITPLRRGFETHGPRARGPL